MGLATKTQNIHSAGVRQDLPKCWAVATPSTNVCLKYSLGTSSTPGILLGSSHLEPKEAQTPLVLPHKPTGTWFPYVLCSPKGLSGALSVPLLKPRHRELMGSPDKTAL